MGRRSKWEYFKVIYLRYHRASRALKRAMLDEFCRVCGYNRKYAIRKLNGPPPEDKPRGKRRQRGRIYDARTMGIIQAVWEAAGYPWSARLKVILQVWMPWLRKRFHLTPGVEKKLRSISARQMDRRLKAKKTQLKKRIYGRTKPGTLLKHHIPIKTDSWNVCSALLAELSPNLALFTDETSPSSDAWQAV
ncbi:MAG: hypothetical protein QGD90_10730 [Candidatus Hydrogenedentes bacterium]|nr:hypothetical protein [Candidatus Hydrogenedentota bacterium]